MNVAEAFDDYRRRLARGELPPREEYAAALGDAYPEFVKAVEAHELLDDLLNPVVPALPRDFGDYRLEREIGRGALGIVYEAVRRTDGERVALKVLRPGSESDPETRIRFRREARACREVRHPGIVEILDAGEIDDGPFFTMAYVDGPDLRALIAARRLPGPRGICAAFAGLADALQAIHDAGVLHRDVKPGNILVRGDGRLVLADFGLARSDDTLTLTRTEAQVGSPLYMSPEQVLDSSRIDARSDVYGLGATLYEALTGRPVFRETTPGALAESILRRRPLPPSRLAGGLPPGCDEVVLKALEKRPEDRYPTAAAFRDDLGAIGDGRMPRGRPVSRTRRAARSARRRWPVLVGAVAVVGAAWAWRQSRPAVVSIRSYPPARVFVDGKERGTSPCSLELPAGSVAITLAREGFETLSIDLELAPGGSVESLLCLPPAAQDDAEALAVLAESLGISPRRPGSGDRAGSGELVACAVLPRGKVSREDLDLLRFEVLRAEAFPAGACELFFRRGDETLWRAAFTPRTQASETPVPAAVREAVVAGDRIVWGVRTATGTEYAAEFDLVEEPAMVEVLGRNLRAVLPEATGGVHAYLAAMMLLDHGRGTAAVGVARAGGDAAAAQAALHVALRELGAGESLLATSALQALDRLPPGRRGAWFTSR